MTKSTVSAFFKCTHAFENQLIDIELLCFQMSFIVLELVGAIGSVTQSKRFYKDVKRRMVVSNE